MVAAVTTYLTENEDRLVAFSNWLYEMTGGPEMPREVFTDFTARELIDLGMAACTVDAAVDNGTLPDNLEDYLQNYSNNATVV